MPNEREITMTETTTDIIEQCKLGNKSAFKVVVANYQRMIFSLALKMMCDEDAAKDIVQDTFIKVWLNIGSYNAEKKLSTWIYTIASRLCLDELKKKNLAALPYDESILKTYASDDNTTHQLENREWISIVKTLAENLSPKQKLVFTLSQLEGLASEEIEKITDLDATQVKSNLYVARQTIRKHLMKLGYGE